MEERPDKEVKAKAKEILLRNLDVLDGLLGDESVPASAKVGLFKELAEMAGEKRRGEAVGKGTGFVLNIHKGTNDGTVVDTTYGVGDLVLEQ